MFILVKVRSWNAKTDRMELSDVVVIPPDGNISLPVAVLGLPDDSVEVWTEAIEE